MFVTIVCGIAIVPRKLFYNIGQDLERQFIYLYGIVLRTCQVIL
jgi:hypothetical protein